MAVNIFIFLKEGLVLLEYVSSTRRNNFKKRGQSPDLCPILWLGCTSGLVAFTEHSAADAFTAHSATVTFAVATRCHHNDGRGRRRRRYRRAGLSSLGGRSSLSLLVTALHSRSRWLVVALTGVAGSFLGSFVVACYIGVTIFVDPPLPGLFLLPLVSPPLPPPLPPSAAFPLLRHPSPSPRCTSPCTGRISGLEYSQPVHGWDLLLLGACRQWGRCRWCSRRRSPLHWNHRQRRRSHRRGFYH